jgi:uncharacterized membrane protein YfcA
MLFTAGVYVGVQNAFAGGASFVTIPMLLLTGDSALSANITSTIALFPAQVATGLASRSTVPKLEGLSLWRLFTVSLVFGFVGAALLLSTPPSIFERLLPWLVLFATVVFAWSNFVHKSAIERRQASPMAVTLLHVPIAIYGGYFGGGIGFLILAALALTGMATRPALAIKNVLAVAMNAAAALIFAFSPLVHWGSALILCAGAIIGGVVGTRLIRHLNDNVLRIVVVAIGALLTLGLFIRAY